MAHAADHEQPDNALGLGCEMGEAVRRRPTGGVTGKTVAMEHRAQREARKTHAQVGQKRSPWHAAASIRLQFIGRHAIRSILSQESSIPRLPTAQFNSAAQVHGRLQRIRYSRTMPFVQCVSQSHPSPKLNLCSACSMLWIAANLPGCRMQKNAGNHWRQNGRSPSPEGPIRWCEPKATSVRLLLVALGV